MSVEQGVADWIDIIDRHNDEHGGDVSLVLQPSEYHRLREDLRCAHSALTFREQQLVELSAKFAQSVGSLDRALALAENYKQLNAKMVDLAKRAIASLKDDGYTTRPFCPADHPGEETLAEFSRRA